MATPLHIRELTVNRAPGFRDGFTLRDLSPGINVVFGPNNVGKSTTARLLQLIVWPDATFEGVANDYARNVIAQAHVSLDESQWLMDLAAGRRRCERDGQEAGPPELPGPEVRSRYHLALHDFLQAENAANRDFAQAVLQESAGGYDLAAAADELKFNGRPSKPRKLHSDLQDADRKVRLATDAQHQLQQKEADLHRLEQRVASARKAHTQVQAIDHVLALLTAQAQFESATEAVAAYPETMALLTGQEHDQLKTLRAEQRQAMEAIESAKRDAEAAFNQLQELALPDDGLTDDLLPTLDDYVAALADVEQQGRQLRAQSAAASDALQQHRPNLDTTDEQLAAIDMATLSDLSRWARARTVAVANHVAAQAAVDQHAKGGPSDTEADYAQQAEQFGEALGVLSRYLQHARIEPSQTAETPEPSAEPVDEPVAAATPQADYLWPALVVAGLLLIAGIVLLFAHIAGLVFIVAAIAAALWVGWLYKQQQQAAQHAKDLEEARAQARAEAEAQAKAARAQEVGEDPADVAQRDYARLENVPQPEAWQRSAAQACLDQVTRELARVRQAAQWQERRQALADALDQATSARAETDTTRDALVDRLGFALSDGAADQDAVLLHLAQRIADWQNAHRQGVQLAKQVEQFRNEHGKLLEQFNTAMTPYVEVVANDAARARGQLQALRDRATKAARAHQDVRNAREKATAGKQRLEHTEEQVGKLFRRFGLLDAEPNGGWPADPEAGLQKLLNQRDGYQKALEAQRTAKAQLAAATQACEGLGATFKALREQDAESLRAQRDAKAAEAETFDECVGELKALETELANARKGRDLEEALRQRDAARAALERQHTDDLAAVVGQTLVDHLREQARKHDQPAVLRKAAELFAMITNGHWRLEFDASQNQPAFHAYDAINERAHNLDELSSGTRVQLLLAVRLAFVELQERSVKLPLILDETLGNSDDNRARAIIAAVAQLAKAGRQVFYFTAQEDEAHKWRTLVGEQGGVAFAEVDLAAARRAVRDHDALAPVQAIGVAAGSFEGPPEPAPDESHQAYGQRLGVERIDPRQPVTAIHLWHLTDSPATLYQALQRGVTHWGQAQTLTRLSGQAIWPDEQTWSCVQARATACEEALDCWRTGRGTPLDRQALEASGAVTGAFIDRVAELCDELKGDAAKLIAALDAGEVKGFRSNKLDDLRTWCEEHGHLDTAQPLTTQQAYVRVLAACSDGDAAVRLSPQEIHAVLAAVGFADESAS